MTHLTLPINFIAEFDLLTWLRYTVWIPLLPAAFFCEGVVALRDIPYFEETGERELAATSISLVELIKRIKLFFIFRKVRPRDAELFQHGIPLPDGHQVLPTIPVLSLALLVHEQVFRIFC